MTKDQELLKGIKDRDPEAFRVLMEQYAGPVINLAYRFLGTQHDAEDAAQDVFLRLYLNPPEFDPGTKLFTWLYRVTVNRCFDVLRRKKREPQGVSIDAASDDSGRASAVPLELPSFRTPRDQAVESETASAVRRAVASLPLQLRAALLLSVFEDMSHQEIAHILSVSPKAVERRIARARELLKDKLAPHLQ